MKLKKYLLSTIAFMLSWVGVLAADPVMMGNNVVGEQGSDAILEVKLYNASPLRDFQLNLSLPEGVSIKADVNGNYLIDVNKEIAPYHAGIANLDGDIYKMVVTAPQDAPILSDGSVLFSVPLVLDAPVGVYIYEFTTVYASQDIDGVVSNVPIADFGGTITVEAPVEIVDMQVYNKKMIVDADVKEATLAVWLKNSEAVKSFTFEMEFPEGITPIYNSESDDYVEYGDRIPSRFDIVSELNGRVLSIDGATTRNSSVAAGNDVLLYIDIAIDVANGTYPVEYVHQQVTLADGSERTAPDFTGHIVVGDGGVSGLGVIIVDDNGDRYYDIQGRRVQQPKAGVYIINGKKVYVK